LELATFLSLGWGNRRTHLSEKAKMKKNVDDHGSTHKKIEKNKREKKWSLKKNVFVKIKRQIVILFYPSCLNQGRKDGGALMFRRNP